MKKKNSASKVNMADFREWQKHTRELFERAKEEELARIGETYKDVLDAQEAKRAALKRVVDGFEAFIDDKPGGRAKQAGAKTYAAFEEAQAEMQRIADEFDAKWYKKLCEYVLETDYLEKEYKRVMKMIKKPSVYETSNKTFWLDGPDAKNGGEKDA